MKERAMKKDRILEALQALAENDRYLAAPAIVETRLIQAFRARRSKRPFRWTAAGSIAIAAALTMIVIANRPQRSRKIVRSPSAEVGTESSQPASTEQSSTVSAPALRPTISKRIPKPGRTEEPAAHELVTDFFPLMDPAPPLDRGEILRVQLPATAMQAVGLPVGEDHLADQIQADVLVGEEGLPRAIRFVKFEIK